jgi:hypothetical protein
MPNTAICIVPTMPLMPPSPGVVLDNFYFIACSLTGRILLPGATWRVEGSHMVDQLRARKAVCDSLEPTYMTPGQK